MAEFQDPLVGFHYRLEIEGKLAGYFTECSGIGSENEIIEHKLSDGVIDFILKVPGRLKWQDVTLKRGITDNMEIWDWRAEVEAGKVQDARTNCSIIMTDRQGNDAARWDFVNAWPSKVSGPSVKSDSNEFGIEEITLVHEGMERVQ